MSDRKLVTSHVYPPIPVRAFDWCAHYDGEEEAGNYGWGATEAEAIADFIENCQEDHVELPRLQGKLREAERELEQWRTSGAALSSASPSDGWR